jgi:hypothetical protein
MAKYSVQVFCPECGGQHDTGIKLSLEDGPAVEQSMGEFYESKELPSDIASLRNNTFSCPRTRKTFFQDNQNDVFLVPIKDWSSLTSDPSPTHR